MIKISPIHAFNDNYIWCIYDTQSLQALVVDPGDSLPVKDFLLEKQLELTAILITHHHLDHTGGINNLLKDYQVPVFGPKSNNIPQITDSLSASDSISLLGLNFSVISIPGHTLDHIALFCAESAIGPLLFCGDTLFAGGCGRIFEGDPAMMYKSLSQLAALPATTRVYCAHEYTMANLKFAAEVEPDNQALQQRIINDGERRKQQLPTVPSTLAIELQTNPFLRCQTGSVTATASLHCGKSLSDPVEIFGVIRGWKDNF